MLDYDGVMARQKVGIDGGKTPNQERVDLGQSDQTK